MRVLRWLGLALLAAIALLFAVGRPVVWTEAALIIWDIAGGGQPTLWQKLTDRPNEYPARWADGEGDVYAPASSVRAAMVLVPGAAVLGRDEPRLQALARTFARAGFVVLVPELPEVRRLALSRVDADRVASALRQLRQWQPGRPIGVAAVSYAVAPAIIAALQDDPAFIVGIGGYHDSEAAIRFVTTGAFRPLGDPREFRVTPGHYGRWAFLLANAGRLEDPTDAYTLQTIAMARFRDSGADVGPLAAKLGPGGKGGAGAGRESRSRCGHPAGLSPARACAAGDRCAQSGAIRSVQAARPSHSGARPGRSAGALQREPGVGGGGVQGARLAVPGR
jgi:hypothetical protein